MSVAFMFNVDDWFSSSDIAAMRADEERGLLRLIGHLWKSLMKSGAGLPADDEESLARWALVSLRVWRNRVGPKLLKLFEVREGRLYNQRLQAEYDNYRAKSETRSGAASTAAKARWAKRRGGGMERAGSVLERMPNASATHPRAMRSACATHPTVIHPTEYKESEVNGVGTADSSHSFEGETSCGQTADGAAPMTAEDAKTAKELLRSVAKRTGMDPNREPDMKITAQILLAAGSLENLVRCLAELQKRNLNHVDSYGYFLRAVQAIIPTSRAG